MPPLGRRAVLKLAVGSTALAALPWMPGRALAVGGTAMTACSDSGFGVRV